MPEMNMITELTLDNDVKAFIKKLNLKAKIVKGKILLSPIPNKVSKSIEEGFKNHYMISIKGQEMQEDTAMASTAVMLYGPYGPTSGQQFQYAYAQWKYKNHFVQENCTEDFEVGEEIQAFKTYDEAIADGEEWRLRSGGMYYNQADRDARMITANRLANKLLDAKVDLATVGLNPAKIVAAPIVGKEEVTEVLEEDIKEFEEVVVKKNPGRPSKK